MASETSSSSPQFQIDSPGDDNVNAWQADQQQQEQQQSEDSTTTTPAAAAAPKQDDNDNDNNGSNNSNPAPQRQYKLETKITSLERTGKKDLIIRFDAFTNLPRFRTSTFRDVKRTHGELVKLFNHLRGANPECFVPAVPPALTSAGAGTEQGDAQVKKNLQKWLDLITSDAILMRDEEMAYFIESDFGYSPLYKRKPPATGIKRHAIKQLQPPPDDCKLLQDLRPIVKQFYLSSLDTKSKLEGNAKARRALGVAFNNFGTSIGKMAPLETHSPMVNMWSKFAKTVMTIGDLQAIEATGDMTTLGDGIGWLGDNAYIAKETLTDRQIIMRELLSAQANTRSKHQIAARLRASSNVVPNKVDEALNALQEANNNESALSAKFTKVTQSLLLAREFWLNFTEKELKSYIASFVYRKISADRKILSVWESVRVDVRAADKQGGLSRLGRNAPPQLKRAVLSQSQTMRGDSWSGDIRYRIDPDIAGKQQSQTDSPSSSDNSTNNISSTSTQQAKGGPDVQVDARNAASMLASATF